MLCCRLSGNRYGNPFDRQIVMNVGQIEISGGVISMLTLMIKGVLRFWHRIF